MNIFKNNKGVSMTLITGFVSLLMVIAAGISELIISNMKSIQRIEASNRAYYASEAGLEDALYELSAHYPGYETPDLTSEDVRSTEFDPDGWENKWQIESISKSTNWSDKIKQDQKLMIYLFNDNSSSNNVNKNAINTNNALIQKVNVAGGFSISFKIPDGIITSGKLMIDNDGDFGISTVNNGVNEDGPADISTTCKSNPEDSDCDGRVDEDTNLDPVIIWKLTDGKNRTLNPAKGCLNVTPDGSEICEDNFGLNIYPVLNQNNNGVNQDGVTETISSFIQNTTEPDAQLHFEFLIVAPMEHIQSNRKYEIPYIEYTIASNSDKLPYPYYTIKSDGYYRAFKQSITAYLTPKTTVPLFDFTIIQQQ